jgi:hypothetical protein
VVGRILPGASFCEVLDIFPPATWTDSSPGLGTPSKKKLNVRYRLSGEHPETASVAMMPAMNHCLKFTAKTLNPNNPTDHFSVIPAWRFDFAHHHELVE